MEEFDQDQIKTYLPIHELDELKSSTASIVDLGDDDLFLVSQVSSYATSTADAVTVSKKLRYGNLSKKLCSDFGILSIASLADDIDFLSSTMYDVSTSLCHEISSSVSALSENITSLSGYVDDNFVKTYGGSYTTLSLNTETSSYYILTSFQIENGQVLSNSFNMMELSTAMALDLNGKAVAGGIIDGSTYAQSETAASQDGLLSYTVGSCDCYLDIDLSAVETDSVSAILGLYIQMSEDQTDLVRICQFNNPGGFPGQTYVNYYHAAVPIAAESLVVVKYDDGSNVVPGTCMAVKEFKITATLAQTELANYVHKVNDIVDANDKALYKLRIDRQGLVTDAEKYDLDKATLEQLGLVKLSENDGDHYGLTSNAGGNAYVVVPKASSNQVGTIKVNGTFDGQQYAVSSDNGGMTFVELNLASSSRAGIAKVADTPSKVVGEQREVYLDNQGVACVQLPKFMPSKPIEAYDIDTPVWLSDGIAMVSFLSSTVHFSPKAVSALNADDDYVLVNATTTEISNKIKYGSLLDQMLKSLSPKKGVVRQLEVSCGVQAHSQYQPCTLSVDESGLYQFEVLVDGSPTTSSRSSHDCFCSLSVNGIAIESTNSAYWHKCLWLSHGDNVLLEAFTSTNAYDNASAHRAIYKV